MLRDCACCDRAGGASSSSPCGPLDSPGGSAGAFRRVHSSCNTLPQAAHSPNGGGRAGSRGVASMDLLTYPNSPAALQQAHRRWSFSAHPNNHSANAPAPPPPMGSEEFARSVYSQALASIHRQQSFALNQLHQVLHNVGFSSTAILTHHFLSWCPTSGSWPRVFEREDRQM